VRQVLALQGDLCARHNREDQGRDNFYRPDVSTPIARFNAFVAARSASLTLVRIEQAPRFAQPGVCFQG